LNLEVRKKGAVTGNPLPLRGTDNGDGTASLDMTVSGSNSTQAEGSTVTGKEAQIIAGKTTGGTAAIPVVTTYTGDALTAASYQAIMVQAGLMALNSSSQLDRLRVDAQKNLLVGLRNASGAEPTISTYPGVDTWGTADRSLSVAAIMGGFDGVQFNRWRNNTEGTLLASAARTVTTVSSNLVNYNAKGILIILRISVASGTGGLIPKIRMIDPVSGLTVQLNANVTAITAAGTYGIELYPGASTALTVADGWVIQRTSGDLPRTYQVQIAHGDGSSYTYSVGYALIV
jgi:hypothetical protein